MTLWLVFILFLQQQIFAWENKILNLLNQIDHGLEPIELAAAVDELERLPHSKSTNVNQTAIESQLGRILYEKTISFKNNDDPLSLAPLQQLGRLVKSRGGYNLDPPATKEEILQVDWQTVRSADLLELMDLSQELCIILAPTISQGRLLEKVLDHHGGSLIDKTGVLLEIIQYTSPGDLLAALTAAAHGAPGFVELQRLFARITTLPLARLLVRNHQADLLDWLASLENLLGSPALSFDRLTREIYGAGLQLKLLQVAFDLETDIRIGSMFGRLDRVLSVLEDRQEMAAGTSQYWMDLLVLVGGLKPIPLANGNVDVAFGIAEPLPGHDVMACSSSSSSSNSNMFGNPAKMLISLESSENLQESSEFDDPYTNQCLKCTRVHAPFHHKKPQRKKEKVEKVEEEIIVGIDQSSKPQAHFRISSNQIGPMIEHLLEKSHPSQGTRNINFWMDRLVHLPLSLVKDARDSTNTRAFWETLLPAWGRHFSNPQRMPANLVAAFVDQIDRYRLWEGIHEPSHGFRNSRRFFGLLSGLMALGSAKVGMAIGGLLQDLLGNVHPNSPILFNMLSVAVLESPATPKIVQLLWTWEQAMNGRQPGSLMLCHRAVMATLEIIIGAFDEPKDRQEWTRRFLTSWFTRPLKALLHITGHIFGLGKINEEELRKLNRHPHHPDQEEEPKRHRRHHHHRREPESSILHKDFPHERQGQLSLPKHSIFFRFWHKVLRKSLNNNSHPEAQGLLFEGLVAELSGMLEDLQRSYRRHLAWTFAAILDAHHGPSTAALLALFQRLTRTVPLNARLYMARTLLKCRQPSSTTTTPLLDMLLATEEKNGKDTTDPGQTALLAQLYRSLSQRVSHGLLEWESRFGDQKDMAVPTDYWNGLERAHRLRTAIEQFETEMGRRNEKIEL